MALTCRVEGKRRFQAHVLEWLLGGIFDYVIGAARRSLTQKDRLDVAAPKSD